MRFSFRQAASDGWRRALRACAPGIGSRAPARWIAEAALLAALTCAASREVFLVPHPGARSHETLLAPLAVWAALRFCVPGALGVTAAMAAFARAAPSHGSGVFGASAEPLAVALFVAALGATSLVLAVTTAQLRAARAKAEASAARSRDLLQGFDLFLLHAPLPMFVRDATGRFVAASGAYSELTGRGRASVVGLTLEEVTDPTFARSMRAEDEHVLSTGEVVRGGFERWGRSLLTIKFRIPAGEAAHVGGYVVDVTERKQTERALRLASVGALASGVAHEVNNPLSFLTANLGFVAEEVRAIEGEVAPGRLTEVHAALREALHGADRVRQIVRDLRQVSSRRRGVQVFDPRSAIETALDLVRGRIRAHAELEERIGAAPHVLGSESELSEALVNVLVNAVEAVSQTRERNLVRVVAGTDPQGRALLQVSDTGRGIAPDELPHVFDPFYTTKEPGSGTGLGLAVARGIVTRMGGEIDVQSAIGAGTTVRIVLPAASEVAQPSDAPTRAEERA